MAFVHFAIAVLFVLLGYIIKWHRWSWLIAGYNTSSREEKAKYDEEALCNYMGYFLFVLAFLVFLAGLGAYLDIGLFIIGSWIVFTIVVFSSLIYMNTGNRFKHDK